MEKENLKLKYRVIHYDHTPYPLTPFSYFYSMLTHAHSHVHSGFQDKTVVAM